MARIDWRIKNGGLVESKVEERRRRGRMREEGEWMRSRRVLTERSALALSCDARAACSVPLMSQTTV
eukprot:3596130-Pleurochrysis_carterae.AAC.1